MKLSLNILGFEVATLNLDLRETAELLSLGGLPHRCADKQEDNPAVNLVDQATKTVSSWWVKRLMR